jgi:hypothetical protein
MLMMVVTLQERSPVAVATGGCGALEVTTLSGVTGRLRIHVETVARCGHGTTSSLPFRYKERLILTTAAV